MAWMVHAMLSVAWSQGPLEPLAPPADAPQAAAKTGPRLSELMHDRLALTFRGSFSVPPGLETQLRHQLRPELRRFGEPVETTDWVHLYSAAGGDLHALLAGLKLSNDAHWVYIVDEDELLRNGALVDALPLLGSNSLVVRNRAADRFESVPDATIAALKRAYRFAPGRAAPLRGDIAVPDLPWNEINGEAWADRLVRWAKRSSRQRDDRALRASLRLLCDPSVSHALTDTARREAANTLFRLAGPDVRSQREADVLQGMDALLRKVPFAAGLRPAPERATPKPAEWIRQTPAIER